MLSGYVLTCHTCNFLITMGLHDDDDHDHHHHEGDVASNYG